MAKVTFNNLHKGIHQLPVNVGKGNNPYDLTNLDFDGHGRPQLRKGYIADDTEVLALEFTSDSGDDIYSYGLQLIKTHVLPSRESPGKSDLRLLGFHDTYAIVGNRLMFVASPNYSVNFFIDLNTGETYPWQLERILAQPTVNSDAPELDPHEVFELHKVIRTAGDGTVTQFIDSKKVEYTDKNRFQEKITILDLSTFMRTEVVYYVRLAITTLGFFYTYANEDYNMETFPGQVNLVRFYTLNIGDDGENVIEENNEVMKRVAPNDPLSENPVLPNNGNLLTVPITLDINTAGRPEWANEIRIYITDPLSVGLTSAKLKFGQTGGHPRSRRPSGLESMDVDKIPSYRDGAKGYYYNPLGNQLEIGDIISRNLEGITFERFQETGLSAQLLHSYGALTPESSRDLTFQLTFPATFVDAAGAGEDPAWMLAANLQTESLEPPMKSADPSNLSHIVHFAGRIWGYDATDRLIRFSLVDKFNVFPDEDNEIPHSFVIDGSEGSPVVAMTAIPGIGGIFVYYRDAIRTIKGRNIVTGLYSLEVPQTDIDASGFIMTGTSSTRSVVTFKNTTIFLGSDRVLWSMGSNLALTNIGQPIQDTLDALTDEELICVISFGYLNRYHIIIGDDIFIWDLTRKYWTKYDWYMVDCHWSTGGSGNESILYGIDNDGNLYQLYESDDDAGEPVTWEIATAGISLPNFSNVQYVYVNTDQNATTPIDVELRDDVDILATKSFMPSQSNQFRQGFFQRANRIYTKISGEGDPPFISSMEVEFNS